MGQENINVQFGAQRQYEIVSADLTLDKFDTGKLLVISSSEAAGNLAGALTCSLPAVSAVEQGFNVLVAVASNHSHSIDGGATALRGLVNQVGDGGLTPGSVALTGDSSIKVGSNDDGDPRGALIEIFCDGTIWHVRATSGTPFTIS